MVNFPIALVLYNPTSSTINRIESLMELGIKFYVFDNSSTKNDILSSLNNINYYCDNFNYGLSYSLNFLCQNIKNDNFDNFLFFDQDTIFTIDTLKYINGFIEYKCSSEEPYFNTILSVNFRDNTTNINNLNSIEIRSFNKYLLTEVYFTINSGSLFFLEHYNLFEWFDRNYFVDGVDYSFSLNVIINKFKNISIINVPGLNHTAEQGDSSIYIFGTKITSRVYSIKRNLDFLRSHFLLLIKTFRIIDLKPKIFIIKAILIYILSQSIFRLISIFSNKIT
jgi:rhamnosyltransferase